MTYVAVCVLQCVTACCSVSQFVAVCVDVGALVPYENIVAVCCSVCGFLQCFAVCCSVVDVGMLVPYEECVAVCCSVLRVAMFCSVLQCAWIWECWSLITRLLHCCTTFCSVSQCVAVRVNV